MKDDYYVKPPSVFKMISNFTKTFGEHIVNGMENVPTNEYAERLDACSKCPHLRNKHMTCGKCGCFVEHKAKWKVSECPDLPSRWATKK